MMAKLPATLKLPYLLDLRKIIILFYDTKRRSILRDYSFCHFILLLLTKEKAPTKLSLGLRVISKGILESKEVFLVI